MLGKRMSADEMLAAGNIEIYGNDSGEYSRLGSGQRIRDGGDCAERFGRLCSALPHSEVMKNRILLSDLDTTISEKVPDGGLDSKINANDIDINSDWLPKGTRVWQFESGQRDAQVHDLDAGPLGYHLPRFLPMS